MLSRCRCLLVMLVFAGWCLAASSAADPKEEDFYRLLRLPIPEEITLEVGALELTPTGQLAVATRRGEIWLVDQPFADPPDQVKFQRYAQGLHEVLGLSYRDGDWWATQRCELTRLRDSDRDGAADLFETISDGWSITGDYHEYALGSPPDRDGNIWVVLCLTGSFSSEVPFRGWCVRITPTGQMIPTCSGIRSPGGIGFNLAGDCFYTDNQGPWNGTCSLKHLRPGGFVGHPDGNKWYDVTRSLGKRPADPVSGSRMMTEATKIPELIPPAVYFPYQKMGQSASGVLCDRSEGKFGPFAGQMFVGDQTHSTVMRVFLEQVDGHYQGACFPFRASFGSGNLALRQAPDGSLFVGGTNRGWGSRGPLPFALERLVWTGKTPFEILEMRARPNGFRLTFTEPVEEAAAANTTSYAIETYTYIYQSSYGSPEVDRTKPEIVAARVHPGGRTVDLEIRGLQAGHVHELHLPGLRSAQGLPLLHREAYYTLNYLPKS